MQAQIPLRDATHAALLHMPKTTWAQGIRTEDTLVSTLQCWTLAFSPLVMVSCNTS